MHAFEVGYRCIVPLNNWRGITSNLRQITRNIMDKKTARISCLLPALQSKKCLQKTIDVAGRNINSVICIPYFLA